MFCGLDRPKMSRVESWSIMKVTRDASNTKVGRVSNSGKRRSIAQVSGRPSPIHKKQVKRSEFPLAKHGGI